MGIKTKPKKQRKKRATLAEQEQIIKYVYTMLIQSFTYSDIVRNCYEKFNCSARNTDNYLAKARAKIREEVEKNIENEYAEAVRQMKEDLRSCLDNRDMRAATAIRRELHEVLGLKKYNLNISGGLDITLSPEERQRKIAEYERKREKK